MKKFALGMIAGVALTAVTAYAAGFRHWTHDDVEAANELFHERSGLRFTVTEPPPDPDRPQALIVHAHAIDELLQNVAVTSRLTDSTIPPGPCFVAHLVPPGPCRSNACPPGPPDVPANSTTPPGPPIDQQYPPGPPEDQTPPGPPDIVLQVLHPQQFSIIAADGSPLELCRPTITVPTN